jgi:SprB repeat
MYVKKLFSIVFMVLLGHLYANAQVGRYSMEEINAFSMSRGAKDTIRKSTSKALLTAPVSTGDPAVGNMYFTTSTGTPQSANDLLLAPLNELYDIHIPFYNYNQTDSVPNGATRFTINLGRKLELAAGFNLAAAPLSNYFTWSQADVAGNSIITGIQSAAIPPDFEALAVFRVQGDSTCRSNIIATVAISNDMQAIPGDVPENNTAVLQYTLPVILLRARVNVTCNGAANGVIVVMASSGTSIVTTGPGGYSNTTNLPTGINSFTLTGLQPGTYQIAASAPAEIPFAPCSEATTALISEPPVLTIPPAGISKTNISCYGSATGSISLAASGGTQPYTYTITGPTVNTTGVISGIFTNLTAGSYTVTVTDNNGCITTTAPISIAQPVGGLPDITLGSDYTGNLFAAPGAQHTIVYNIAESNGTAAVGDTIRITKIAGYTITLNPALTAISIGGTNYVLDNPRWKIDISHPAFTSIILTDPANALNPGTLLCNQLVRVAVTLTRNSPDIAAFAVSARLRRANGEVNMSNSLNSVLFSAE